MPKLPPVSGSRIVSLLLSFDYTLNRRKGSHATYAKTTHIGMHVITVPLHKEIAKGTLNDILNKISLYNHVTKQDLIEKLKKL
jgi:predicted RNA binding protein YcfA (HicA-like mRNA interferase family)